MFTNEQKEIIYNTAIAFALDCAYHEYVKQDLYENILEELNMIDKDGEIQESIFEVLQEKSGYTN